MQTTIYQPGYQQALTYMRLGHLPTSAFLRDSDLREGKELAVKKLKRALGHANESLATATAVFPFNFFPDTIMVDREKVTIAHRFFFLVAEVITIRNEDILNVAADVGPFFGSIKITSRFFDAEQEPYSINYLWRSDAERIKRMIQGCVIATNKKIDCSTLSTPELRKAFDELGRAPAEKKR